MRRSKKLLTTLTVKTLLLSIIYTSFFSACRSDAPLEESYLKAGSNRQQLEGVIEHFKAAKNPKKLEAAKILIAQMNYQFHYQGSAKDSYDSLHRILAKTPYERMEYLEVIWDSLKKSHQLPMADHVEPVSDLKNLKAEELIEHIDAAFEAWQRPWAKNLSFYDFCEYILPYKLVDERPGKWMQRIQKRYHRLFARKTSDPYEACLLVNAELKKDFKIRSFPALWDLNFGELDLLKSGKCYHATQYTTYVMRSMGLPVTMDFTPLWGNMNGGHEWNALMLQGRPIPFVGSESDPGLTKIDLARGRKRAKVFRRSYFLQPSSLAAITADVMEIPSLFRSAQLQDVTAQYISVSAVIVGGLRPNASESPLFLCVFNNQKWLPTAWATVNARNASFTNMGRDIVYLPAYYQSGEVVPAGNPILVDKEGRSTPLNGKTGRTKLVVKQKSPEGPKVMKGQEYELMVWEDEWKIVSRKKALSDSLVYESVPRNRLFRITSKDKVSKERIFMVNNAKPLWK